MSSLKIISIFLVIFAASAYAAPYDPSVDQPGYILEPTTTPCPPFDLKQKLDNVKEKVKEAGKAIGKTFSDVKLALKNKLDKITGKTPPPKSPVKPPTVLPPTSYSPPVYPGETTYVPSENYQPGSGYTSSVPEYDIQSYSEVVPQYDGPVVQSNDEPAQVVTDVIAQPVDNFYRISESKND